MSIADFVILSLALLSVAVLIFVKVRALHGKRKNKGCCTHCCGCAACAQCACRQSQEIKESECKKGEKQ